MVTMDLDREDAVQVPVSSPIDELRYSRLIYTLGMDAMQNLQRIRVLIVGCKGLGAEIAKNLLLSGIASVGLMDNENVCLADLGSNFCLRESDVGFNRAATVAGALHELRPSGDVHVVIEPSIEAVLSHYDVVAATVGTLPDLNRLNLLCRAARIPFIAARSIGLFSFVFADLGETYVFKDENIEQSFLLLVANITQDDPATVTIVEDQRLDLRNGDEVTFSGIKGMEGMDQAMTYTVTVTGTHTFSIPIDTRGFGRYISGGYIRKVTPVRSFNYLPLETSLSQPLFSAMDNPELSKQPHLHVALQAVDECIRVGRGNAMGSGALSLEEAEYEKIVARGKEIWQSSSFLSSEVWLCDRKGQKQRCEAMPATEVCSSADANAGRPREIKFNTIGSFNEKLMKALAQTIDAELCPLIAVTGGFAAQEVIKASGKVFTPLHQWIYFDAVDCMPSDFQIALVKHPVESRYDQQIALFGRDFQQMLGSLKWLVVGAGSIGCEVLKNLVLMGVGCNSNGSIMITDMDCISKPNYSNQILYRMEDLGKEKAPTAGRALQKINPEAQIHTFQEKFDAETESIFDSTFLQSISGVFSAVDTASSRLYIDMRCVTFRKPMIDGGKHGAKGSVQVFIPFQSEMYASTRDPPEFKETPICTLRNFPYTTEHTLHWSVETFDSLFKQRPSDVNAYLSNRDFQDSLKKTNPSARLPILETLCDALSRHKPLSFAACIQWARLQFEDLFSNNIKQLSFNFPEDMVTTTGAPFWSGTKRSPVPITFNVMDPLHYCFIVAAANLQATVYGLKGCQDRGLFLDVLQNMDVPVFQPKEGVRIATSDADIRSGGQQKGSFMTTDDNGAAQKCDALMQELPTPASLAGYRLTCIEFEKDDERNFHIEFVSAAANLRAQNYGIPTSNLLQVLFSLVLSSLVVKSAPFFISWSICSMLIYFLYTRIFFNGHTQAYVSRFSNNLQARFVGGRVIPSIITTASVVGGLMCLELLKLALQRPVEYFKHTFVNLAVPSIASAEPMKAIVNKVERSNRPPLLWTLWDKFEMNCVGMSLEMFLREFRQQHGLEITMLSYGKSLLYAEFVPKKKLQERMPLTLVDLITAIAKVSIPANEKMVIFSISCLDASDTDVDVPDVVVQVR